MTRIDRIKKKLDVLKPQYLEVVDKSTSHQEHFQGTSEEGQTHLVLNISSELLKGKTMLEQHKTIMHELSDEFEKGLHALSINII